MPTLFGVLAFCSSPLPLRKGERIKVRGSSKGADKLTSPSPLPHQGRGVKGRLSLWVGSVIGGQRPECGDQWQCSNKFFAAPLRQGERIKVRGLGNERRANSSDGDC